jgi:hypothetical protein
MPPASKLDELLPSYDFSRVHRTPLAVPPSEALATVKAVTPGEMPLMRVLFALRSLPALVTRRRGLPAAKERPLVEQMIEFGFVPLAEEDDELVLGFVGQPWKLSGGSMPRLSSAAEWTAFDEPGYVKAAMNFRADGATLSTETRVRATDPGSRRRFTPYWRGIRPGSGLVRRSWLRAARRLSSRRELAVSGRGPR